MATRIWFDGSYDWKTRKATGGCVIEHEGGTLNRTWEFGQTTMNGCEFLALIKALRLAKSIGASDLVILGDSKLVVCAVNRRWKAKKPHIKAWVKEVRELLEGTKFNLQWIPREQNRADEFSRPAAPVESAAPSGKPAENTWLDEVSAFIS